MVSALLIVRLLTAADQASFERQPSAITAFKNGGGAHLDLMVADRLLKKMEL